jgi:inhibitor of cysteine peptidase
MSITRAKAALAGIVLLALAIAGGCTSGTDSNPTSIPAATTVPGATPTGIGIRGQAKVDSVEVKVTGSAPNAKVQVVARGTLPDGCTKITDISQKRDGNTFTVTLGTYRAPNVMCIQVITPYIETVDLDTTGLTAGTYTVVVNGVSTQFTLP